MLNTVTYRGQSVLGPSRDLWHDCPVAEMLQDPSVGLHVFDDFSLCPTWSAPSSTKTDKYEVYGDTGVVIGPAGLQGGGLKISGNDADNDEGSIQAGGGGLLISATSSVARKLWFEAKLQKSTVGDNGVGFFLGLMTPASAAPDILVDNDATMAASKSYLGFRVLQDNGEEVDFVHADSTGSIVEWGAAIASMTAATDITLGFKFDPEDTKRIRLWINGVEYVTDYLNAADLALATFPLDVVLAPMLATKVGTAAEAPVTMKWWRWAQLGL